MVSKLMAGDPLLVSHLKAHVNIAVDALPLGTMISVFRFFCQVDSKSGGKYNLDMPLMALIKFLSDSGVGSRRKSSDAVRQGRVRVNGVVADSFNQEIDTDRDHVSLDGHKLAWSGPRKIYLMLNKPEGVITTTSDEKGRRTVLDIIPDKYKSGRLYPAGRLDGDSTGLVILTNDGDLTYRLTHPSFEHDKEYLVAVDGSLSREDRRRLEGGVELEDGRSWPSRVRAVRGQPPFNYSITIHEGRNRQVRRMLDVLGYRVRSLKRVRMGNLRLGNLEEGKVRELTGEEVARLLSETSD